ncbi:hypothetical protein [Paraburkholderia antibiotica]|nr:hypothetical protein [Paraburkholderia antibiotica]
MSKQKNRKHGKHTGLGKPMQRLPGAEKPFWDIPRTGKTGKICLP